MYEIVETSGYPKPRKVIFKTDDNGVVWSVPEDEANSDYQDYLLYISQQNNSKL